MKLILGVLLVSSIYAEHIPFVYKELNYSSYIDHYAYNDEMFELRYMVNDTFYGKKNQTVAPIFFYCGNEGEIELFINNTGYMEFLGENMGAALIFAEHRYFGKSMPFGDKSFSEEKYRRYLSPHQALADFAYLIDYLKSTPEYKDAPVVAWGGSYGGMLAAWMRIKYPNLVVGAIASSAPIMHFIGDVDPARFNEIVTTDFADIYPICPSLIKKGFLKIQEYSTQPSYYPMVQRAFNTCESIAFEKDVLSVNDWMQNAFTYMAMTDYPYPTNFLNYMPGNPVNVSCQILEQLEDPEDIMELFGALRNATNVYYNYRNPEVCSDTKQHYDSRLGQDGWDYLSCTTLNIPISSNGETDMFLNQPWNQIEVNSQCVSDWGIAPDLHYGAVYFGSSSDPSFTLRHATNIVFANGSRDPWQSGAVTQDFNDKVIAFVMPGAAHHLELRYPNDKDPPEVDHGRVIEQDSITNWLNEYVA